MKQISYLEAMPVITERMSNGGVFLSVGGERPNTMTIGWAFFGYCWKRPVFVALIRASRHTYDLLVEQGCFTVSAPMDDSMKAELAFAGTKSGRDFDKFEGHGLTAAKAQKVTAPIVKECAMHMECVVKLTEKMTTDQMDKDVENMGYPNGDLHFMFFGEIVDCYRTDK